MDDQRATDRLEPGRRVGVGDAPERREHVVRKPVLERRRAVAGTTARADGADAESFREER
jgi:hypothetical protein